MKNKAERWLGRGCLKDTLYLREQQRIGQHKSIPPPPRRVILNRGFFTGGNGYFYKRYMPLMRHFIIIILLIFAITKVTAQIQESKPVKKEFKNQGEQEDYWAEKLFEEKYAKQNYKKFAGDIVVVDKNHIKFGNKILRAYFSPEFLSIFTQGIFYPQVITGDSVAPKKSEEEISKMTDVQRVFYRMTQNDTLAIGEFEELKFLSTAPTIKRFRFWEYRKWSANPQVYFIELTNTTADKSTDLTTFIKGATLTFVKGGWTIM